MANIPELVAAYAPHIYFSKDERYMPASFEYMVDKSKFIFNGKQLFKDSNGKTDKKAVANKIKDEINGIFDGSPNLIWDEGVKDNQLLLDLGDIQGADGYAGKPDPNNSLYGNPDSPVQYINAYTLGEITAADGTKFIDICYAVYFMWNGTVDYHSADVEEIIIRFQYFQTWDVNGYANVQDRDFILSQGIKNPCGKWAAVRVFLSAHGNGMWYPTSFPGKPKSTIEFEDGTHPIIYSALGGHAMYPNAGKQKRIFGFADDVTKKGKKWTPNRVAFWNPAFVHESCSNNKRGKLTVLDVESKKIIKDNNPFLYLSYLNGKLGNPNNSQSTLPFKNGLLNLISSGDAYYKFQKGGPENAIVHVMTPATQKNIMVISFIAGMFMLMSISSFWFLLKWNNIGRLGSLVIFGSMPLITLLIVVAFVLYFFIELTGSTNLLNLSGFLKK